MDSETWLEGLEDYFRWYSNTRYGNRGKSYAVGGHVISLGLKSDGSLHGKVVGNAAQPYRVTLQLIESASSISGHVYEGVCSCPVRRNCKHCYALAVRVLGGLYRFVPDYVPWAPPCLPGPWRKQGKVLPATYIVSGEAPWEALGGWETVEETPVATDTTPWWRTYLDADTEWGREEALLEGLRTIFPAASSWVYQSRLNMLREEFPGRVAVLREFVSEEGSFALQYLGRRRPDRTGLREWLASEEAARFEVEELRASGAELLLRWLEDRRVPFLSRQDHVEVTWQVLDEGEAGFPALVFEVLLTTKTIKRKPRNAQGLEQLSRDLIEGRRFLSPEETALVHWIERHNSELHGGDPGTLLPVQNGLNWLARWAHRRLIHWEDTGAPVAFLPEPALITLTRQGERLLWAARLEKGEAPVALHELTLVADQAYNQPFGAGSVSQVYVRSGDTLQSLSTGGMPIELIRLAHRFPEVPLETIRTEGLGQELVEHLESIGALEDAPAVQEISVRPRVEFYLASTQRLHVRAVAEGGADITFVRREAGDWTLASSKEANGGDLEYAPVDEGEEAVASEETAVDSTAIAYRPRESDLEAVDGWIDALVPEYARHDSMPAGLPSLSWSMRDMGLLDLIEIWEQRPRNAVYYGNQALRDLLSLRRAPRYDFEVEASGVQWLTVSVSMQEAVDALSFEEVAAALKEQDTPNILLRGGGRYRREDLETYETQVRTLAEVGIAPDSGAQRVHALQLGALSGEVFGDATGNAQKLIDQAEAMRRKFKGIPKVKLAPSLVETVRPYQQTGVDFLVWACVNFGGAILADDMGLGKTLQVLATLTVLRRKKGGKKPALVVCPASVTHNWQREAARFTPGLRTLVLESGEARKGYYGKLDQYDLVIKNYALARRDIEALREQAWGVVCIDEAQAIKNPNAAISKALKTLEAKHRIALTGTPIENRLSDLWSIVDFAVPGYLPPREAFEKKSGGAADALAYTRLRARLRPILLRRLKGEVAPELPPRIEERLDCTMTSGQRKAYLTELRRAQDLLRGTTGKQVTGQSRIQILAALTRLRQLCCDPALRNIPKAGSGKVDVFLECIEELMESGHKVLVFSQFVTMLELLAPKLKKRKIKQYMLTGKTRKRAELVAAFEADPDPSVFLISLKAGGSGLNLVSASYVVLFDPWWNPAVEAQAIDRTHRIGQDKTVVAYRLVTEDSIEERILELQEKKREIVANVLEADAFNRSLSREDFAFILE